MKLVKFTLALYFATLGFSQGRGPEFTCFIEGNICEIKNSRGDAQMKGQLADGKMSGLWTVWDSQGTKNAEINLSSGQLSGPTILYFGSLHNQEWAGKLKAKMNFRNDKLDGINRYFAPNGEIRLEFIVSEGRILIKGKAKKEAKKEVSNDRKYLDVILNTARDTISSHIVPIDNSRLVVKKDMSFLPSLSGYLFPKGIYLPVAKDSKGTFYQSPIGIKAIGLGGGVIHKGGIYRFLYEDGSHAFKSWIGKPKLGFQSRNLHDMLGAKFSVNLELTSDEEQSEQNSGGNEG